MQRLRIRSSDRVTLSHMVTLADLNAKYARVFPAAEIIETLGFA